MKIISLALFLVLLHINLFANEKWIPIESIHKTPKQNTKLDVNLSQIEPINKMLKNATAVKELLDATSKKEKTTTNDKNWFVLNSKDMK